MTSPFPTPPVSGTPKVTKRFRAVELIARHGQGEVWKAEMLDTGIHYAMKKLLPTPEESASQVSTRRFHREVRTQSSLKHPGIMNVIAYNFSVEPPWYVMPLAENSLRDTLKSRTLDEDESVAIVLEVADALAHAHREGVVHRDVKPENVLFMDGRWLLTDFGLCRDVTADSTTFTRTGTGLGTLPYMAPEQWTDPHNVGEQADVFALGRMLYECLTGHVPWPAMDPAKVPDRFRYVVTKSTADASTSRYPSIDALVNDLHALTRDVSNLALPLEHAKQLADNVAGGGSGAADSLLRYILDNLSDEVFLRDFLPTMTPPVMASLRSASATAFNQIVRAFEGCCEGRHAFSWTDSAATFLERAFHISTDSDLRDLLLRRILIIGRDHNRWAVRDVYVGIITALTSPADVLMVATHLAEYPEGVEFLRPAAEYLSLPKAIADVLVA